MSESTQCGAVIVFRSDITLDQAEKLLAKWAKDLKAAEVSRQWGPVIQSMTVDTFNPEWGSPVFYVP